MYGGGPQRKLVTAMITGSLILYAFGAKAGGAQEARPQEGDVRGSGANAGATEARSVRLARAGLEASQAGGARPAGAQGRGIHAGGSRPAEGREAGAEPAGASSGCLRCHSPIEDIREPGSEMLQRITSVGAKMGDPAGCVVCHGGDPSAAAKSSAHADPFYPDPGSPWINEVTCGRCHPDQVRAQWQSLMMTEAGKIQGLAWSAGALTGYEHRWANYDVAGPENPDSRLGAPAYRAYKERLAAAEPQAFPPRMEGVPAAPAHPDSVAAHPELAALTYLRAECERCHLAVRGRQMRGDYRGMGCSACHIPYGNEGLYEGKDPTVPRDQPGHLLLHRIQATREAVVEIHGTTYSGIPIETCTTCHDRGKRIGVTFQGLMETAYHSPWGEKGESQPALHSKHYLSMHGDVHGEKGMLCQDCHTTLDVHGDGFLAGTDLASVEIECADCHGTPRFYPWELPLGFGDEFGLDIGSAPRGTTQFLLPQQGQGTVYPPLDGYLVSARGNPMGNVVRSGDKVIVHTAGGKDMKMEPLKLLYEKDKLEMEGRVAMAEEVSHMKSMECYACHSRWAPQCYGCHVKVDYSRGASSYDWVAAGRDRMRRGKERSNRDPHGDEFAIAGRVEEQRSYLRWEDPMLGVNGEGRITPIIPGCQVNYTVVAADGETVIRGKIFRSPPGTEGAGPQGQLTIDMSPVQPHTNGHPRSCESCHASAKAAGYGIAGGALNAPTDTARIVDLMTADGRIIPAGARVQFAPIAGLEADWSRVVTEKGRQLQTVGHHFKGSRPLNEKERSMLDRRGVCLACHREIPEGSRAVDLLHHIAEKTGSLPTEPKRHVDLVHKILLISAWGQVGGAAAGVMVLLILAFIRRR